MKSKWRAQKRKEGLAGPRAHLEQLVDAEQEQRQADGEEEDHVSESSDNDDPEADEQSDDESGDETSEDEASPPRKPLPISKPKSKKDKPPTKEDERPSLRDLERQAYSRSSLHTHKANPLGRHKGVESNNRGRGGRGGRGGQTGRGRGRGRGQPDMGLRMKAMLERIKQDYA